MKRASLILLMGVFFMMPQRVFSGEHGKFAVFAGGCFWCMQPPYDSLDGVLSTTVGYTGGTMPAPSYEDVSTGRTGHVEAVRIEYDPQKVSYRDLLKIFFRSIDPTDPGGQFVDRGSQYETAIFYADEGQKHEAEAAKKELEASGRFKKPVATRILPAAPFYPAEAEHQQYYKTHSLRYKLYKAGSGRE
ncbi:MAG: peptide-methionine (S)-S-oxide reductase MsrA [Candidatus Omnitrophica bacterium]|nr:peptide-methionine (S)-S-oxide reductase MsrA [Candidatus Omnitrophota bacterium]